MDKDKKLLFGIGIVFLFLATVGFTYAYFTATIVNKDVKDQVVQTGTLELTYTDSPQIIMNNIKPGATITKEISVKNTGTLNASYNLVWQELSNEIINDEMVISATCKRLNGGIEEEACEGVNETPIKENIIKKNVSIEPGITHEYNVTIIFKETNEPQNYNQGKTFNGVLGIDEVVNCTYDGEMVQGAEYINGQYTYRYKQEGTYTSSEFAWSDIAADGWGVQLTDKTSTDPVTSKLCAYINNKPVVSLRSMFENSQAKILDVSNFDTSKVTNMRAMFANSKLTTLDVSNFNTSKVTDMSYMFGVTKINTINVSNFNTSNVTNMSGMFFWTQATTLNVNNFDTSKVTDMSAMFQESQAKTLDVSNFDTSKVTNMRAMFRAAKATALDLSNFDTFNVTDMSEMFYDSKVTTLDLSSFDTSKVGNMRNMFSGSQAATLDLSSFNTRIVGNMSNMFNGSTNLKTIYVSNKFFTTSVTNSSKMFDSCTSLVGGAGTKYDVNHVDKTYARIDGGTSSPGYFTLKQ